ncbi:hypothetical protein GC177_05250 [bacterium]|nr:hypothetical protein [bacterium]
MGQNYQFHEHIGGLIAFNKHVDTLTIRAASPNDVTITNYARDLLVATKEGRVILRGMQISDLTARNIQFAHTYPTVGKGTTVPKNMAPIQARAAQTSPTVKPAAAVSAPTPPAAPRMPSLPQPVRNPAAQTMVEAAKTATAPQPFANGGWLGNRWQPNQKIPPAMERPTPRLNGSAPMPQRPTPAAPQPALTLPPAPVAPEPIAQAIAPVQTMAKSPNPEIIHERPAPKASNVTVTSTATSLFDFALSQPAETRSESATLTTTSKTERTLGNQKKTTDIVRLTAPVPQSAASDPFALPKSDQASSNTVASPIATTSAPKPEAKFGPPAKNGQMVYVPPETMPPEAAAQPKPVLQDTRPTPAYIPPVQARPATQQKAMAPSRSMAQAAPRPMPQAPVQPPVAQTPVAQAAPSTAPAASTHNPMAYVPAPAAEPRIRAAEQAGRYWEAADLVYAEDEETLVTLDALSETGDDQRPSSLVAWPWRTAGLWS